MPKDCNTIAAIISVIGTLSGVLLGVLLNKIFSSGRLKIFQNDFEISYFESDNVGGFIRKDKFTTKTEHANINFELDFYNSSSEPKIARNIFFLMENKQTKIRSKIYDLDTQRLSDGRNIRDELETINIPPKAVLNFKLAVYILKENLHLVKKSRMYMHYKNSKNVAKLSQIVGKRASE